MNRVLALQKLAKAMRSQSLVDNLHSANGGGQGEQESQLSLLLCES